MLLFEMQRVAAAVHFFMMIRGPVNDVAELAIVAEKFAGHVAVLPHLTQLLIIQLALFFENGEWDIDLANIV